MLRHGRRVDRAVRAIREQAFVGILDEIAAMTDELMRGLSPKELARVMEV